MLTSLTSFLNWGKAGQASPFLMAAETVGGTPTIDLNFSKFGGGSLAIPNVQMAVGANVYYAGYLPGTSDWTVEAWLCPTAAGSGRFFFQCGGVYTGGFMFTCATDRADIYLDSILKLSYVGATANNAFSHWAFERYGANLYIYKDGVQVASGSASAWNGNFGSPLFSFGSPSNTTIGNNQFKGWIDEIRYTKGVARYTAGFTPPTAEFPRNNTDPNIYNVVLLCSCNQEMIYDKALANMIHAPWQAIPVELQSPPNEKEWFRPIYKWPEVQFATNMVSRTFGKIWVGRDVWYGGAGKIVGVTRVQTGPASFTLWPFARVLVMDQFNGYVVRETISDANGNYTVTGLDTTKTYMAIAQDRTNTYDLAATRNLTVTL